MGRYIIEEKDKAAELEAWFAGQVEALKKELQGAEISEADLLFRDPFTVSGETYNNGFASLYVKVADRTPEFLNETDGKIYWGNLEQYSKKEFGVQIDPGKELSYAAINFDESTEEELYMLTERKKALFAAGFQRIKNYVSWHRACAKRYRELVVEEHQRALKSYFKNCVNV